MVLVAKFCFWFSVRLGSIIIGVFTLIQSTVCFMVCLISFYNLEDVTKYLQSLTRNLSLHGRFFKNFASDPRTYLMLMVMYFNLMIISCILLLYGAFKCKRKFLIPFIALDFFYIIFLLVNHIFLMIALKKQDIGLGVLITYSNIGGLACLYLLYMWLSVISFYQILKELEIHSEHQLFKSRSENVLIPVRPNHVKY